MMTTAELDELPVTVSLEQAARAIGIGRDRAYTMARAGQFPVRILPGHGTRRRISKADLLAYLNGGERRDGAA
jgi:excisionase family DNA binding protein